MTCKDNRDGSCTVEYVPTEPGEYDVSIKFAEQHIPGSPFKVNVDKPVEATNVRAYGPGLEAENCRAGQPQNFTIDARDSAPAPLAVSMTATSGQMGKKPEVLDNGDGTYTVHYVAPSEPGAVLTANVTWAGQSIQGSPFRMNVQPGGVVMVEGVQEAGPGQGQVPASLPHRLTIDSKGTGGEIGVSVVGPDGKPRAVTLRERPDGSYEASYVPDDCGRYRVDVTLDGKPLPEAPFHVQAFATGDATQCHITERQPPQQIVSPQNCCITVDAQNAGYGAVTCRIRSTSGSDLDIDIEDAGDGTFRIYYTVKDAGEYTVSLKFGGQPLPDGFYTFRVSLPILTACFERQLAPAGP